MFSCEPRRLSHARTLALVAPLLLALTAPPAHAQQSPGRAFTIDDALDVNYGRIEAVSRDGRRVALSIRERRDGLGIDHARFGDPTYVAPSPALFELIDAVSGKTRRLFPAKVNERGATFSRDGSRLAFLIRMDSTWALYVHDVAADRTRRVPLRTKLLVASSSPLEWSPDGKSVLVTLRPAGWLQEARQAFLHMTDGPIVVQDASKPFLAWDAVRNLGDRQIPAIVTVGDGSVREILPETNIRGARFSADGSYLVYTDVVPKKTSYTRRDGTDYAVYEVALAPGSEPDTLIKPAERRLNAEWNDGASAFAYAEKGDVYVRWLNADSARDMTKRYRKPASKTDTSRMSFSIVAWRPDGDALLLGSRDGYHLLDAHTDSMSLVYRFESDTAARPRRDFQQWSHDGRYLFLSTSARDHWARGIERYDLTTQKATELAQNADVYSSWHVSDDGTRFVFERSDGDHPNEVYTAGSDFSNPHALTHLNPQLDGVALTHSELVSYLDVDGKKLYGVLYYPYGYQAGKKYPLVAEIYETFFDNGYNENMNLLAAQGWFVFHPSVDLHIGYPGEAWVKAVTDGINSLEQKGLVDGTKLGVEGQSYGGYATNLLITQTDRFAAAVNISGKVDIISFLGDSPKIGTRNYAAAEVGQDRIGETLWQAPLKYIQHSAVMFADRIHTPLLMLTGKDDWNVPYTNEREMYFALRRLGREAVWVQYWHAGHGAGRAGTVDEFHDQWTRIFDWFATHFDHDKKGAEAAGEANR
jgi:dipeptidyl aminopeptidase/acylaminoacyl peptidase